MAFSSLGEEEGERQMFFEWKESRSLSAEDELWVPASLHEAWEPEKEWDCSHTRCTHHLLYVSAAWCCTECDNFRTQVPPSSSSGSLSELPRHGHICLQFQLSQLERFHSPASFSCPRSPLHAPSIQTHLPFSPFPYLFAPEISILLSLPAELSISHSWQQESNWQRPRWILLKPSQVIAPKTNWGGITWAGQIDR